MDGDRREFLRQSWGAAALAIGGQAGAPPGKLAETGELIARMTWLNEPASHVRSDDKLVVRTRGKTDFWRKTFYGYVTDNGHFLHLSAPAEFSFQARVGGRYAAQYDQAGLMVRISATCWLKTSVEHEPGRAGRLGVVVTNAGYSDWSTQPFTGDEVALRVRREGADYVVDASADGREWEQIRIARLHEDRTALEVAAGLYACSPKGAGFVAEFLYLEAAPGRLK